MSLHSNPQPFTRGHRCAHFLLDPSRGLVCVYSGALMSTYVTHHTLRHTLHTVLHTLLLFSCLVFEILLYPPLSVHRGFPYCLIDSLSAVFILSHVYTWFIYSVTCQWTFRHLQLLGIQAVLQWTTPDLTDNWILYSVYLLIPNLIYTYHPLW